MKHLVIVLLIVPLLGFGQLSDDFSDGDFTNNPAWVGDVTHFQIDANDRLQLSAPAVTDMAHLSTDINIQPVSEWAFDLMLDFNPSGSNLFQFHLMSDSANLESEHNGYYVQIGGSNDEVSLFRMDGASTPLLIDGIDDRVDLDPVNIAVKVIRLSTGVWKLYSKLESDSAFILEGTTSDNTYPSLDHCGLLCDYTSTRSTLFWFDNVKYNIGPKLLSATPTGNSTLLLSFDEQIEPSGVSTSSNYQVDNGLGNPVSAMINGSNASEVILTFSDTFITAQPYVITVTNLTDTLGNELGSGIVDFVYIPFAQPDFQSIILTEIMANPSPSVGLPELEFVEIFNASNHYFDLATLAFADANDTVEGIISEYISPSEYIILCDLADTSAFSSFGRVIGLTAFPALNNDGDDLSLMLSNTLTDFVAYTDSWYGDSQKSDGGFTLERINPYTSCSGSTNWKASESTSGGSPGVVNSVYNDSPDLTPPRVVAVEFQSLDNCIVQFSEPLDTSIAQNAVVNFSGEISIDSVALNNPRNELSIWLSNPVEEGVSYTLMLSQIEDCEGNLMPDSSIAIGFGKSPEPFDLIINEIYAIQDPASPLPEVEFVEVYNRSDYLISTASMRLGDRTSSSEMEEAIIMPGEYIIVCDDNNETLMASFGRVIPVSSMPSLNNSDDALSLTFDEIMIDRVSYEESWYNDESKADGGWTLERINPNNLCGTKQNWSACVGLDQGTPGKSNSIEDKDTPTDLSLLSATFQSLNSILLAFDGRLDTTQQATATFDGAPFELESEGEPTLLSLLSTDTFERGKAYELQLNELVDCSGSPFNVSPYTIYLHDMGDIIINEVLFNPRESGTDFVELYNNSDHAIDLKGWNIGYYDSNDSLRFNAISEDSYPLEVAGFLALNEDATNVLQNYPLASSETLLDMNLPSYSNDEGTVLIYDPIGSLMDRFDYSENFHFALIDDPDGVSLERLSPDLPTNDQSSWHSASSTDNYATPGYTNSQDYRQAPIVSQVELSAEMISPDNDGFQDVVGINYNFTKPGYSITITIYSDKGVLIRRLISNKIIGATGTFTWDGTTDSGEKAATGIHIVMVEAFNLQNEKERFRLPIVVATKL